MAVVQISRVQVRRGRKNAGTSVPQLASGEMGWAIDSQELFIGNGSIQEGSPYVGNTKILTEHDNILDLALQYEYKRKIGTVQTGPTAGEPIQRTFQDRLDDTVSVRGFGVGINSAGDYDGGTYDVTTDKYTFRTDDTADLQRAIDQLFLVNFSAGDHLPENRRVILTLEPGIFQITNSLKLPPYAVLRGAGKDKTIIVQTENFPVFQTVGSTTVGVDGYVTLLNMNMSNQPRHIDVSGMTLRTTLSSYPVLVLESTVSSTFNDVKFQSKFDPVDKVTVNALSDMNELDSCLQLKSTSSIVTSKDNLFVNCEFVGASYGINSTYDIDSNTFDNCLFYNLGEGVLFGKNVNPKIAGQKIGPKNTKIINSKFDLINRRGINIINGRNNLSSNNSFFKVGNDGGDSRTAIYSIIHFGEGSNVSDGDYFQRSEELTNKAGFQNFRYISEISGIAHSNHKYNLQKPIMSAVNSTFVKLPGNVSSRINLHYIYNNKDVNIVRHGTLFITVDKFNNTVRLTDEYDISGNTASFESSLSFIAVFENLTGLPIAADTPTENLETVNVKYTNTTGDAGYINFWYEILS